MKFLLRPPSSEITNPMWCKTTFGRLSGHPLRAKWFTELYIFCACLGHPVTLRLICHHSTPSRTTNCFKPESPSAMWTKILIDSQQFPLWIVTVICWQFFVDYSKKAFGKRTWSQVFSSTLLCGLVQWLENRILPRNTATLAVTAAYLYAESILGCSWHFLTSSFWSGLPAEPSTQTYWYAWRCILICNFYSSQNSGKPTLFCCTKLL